MFSHCATQQPQMHHMC